MIESMSPSLRTPGQSGQPSMVVQSFSEASELSRLSHNCNNSRDGRLPKLTEYSPRSRNGHENAPSDDEEEEHGGLGSRWRQQRMKGQGTPRPDELGALGAPPKRGSLAPIGHVGHLEPLENYAGQFRI